MRGSPLLRALVTLVFLGLMAWPVWRVTRAVSTIASPPPASLSAAGNARLQISFLPVPPIEFEVRHLGKSIWRGGGKLADESPPLAMNIPAEGVDLQLTARWPDDTRSAAARLQLAAPDGATVERLTWTSDSPALDTVLTFQSR